MQHEILELLDRQTDPVMRLAVHDFKRDLDYWKTLEYEVEDLERRNQELESDLAEIEREYEAALTEIDDLHKEIADLQEQCSAYDQNEEYLWDQINDLQSQLEKN